MRLLCGVLFNILFVFSPVATAESTAQIDLSGTWTFTWDNDGKNTNPVVLKHAEGTISGTYTNDSKQNCPVAGRLNSSAGVILVIMCPTWDIKCEGSVESPASIDGKYVAYGDSNGNFKMSRN